MSKTRKITHNVSKFKTAKCYKCKSIFPFSKAIHILQNNLTEKYCSRECLPKADDLEILNCNVCNQVVEQNSIFCCNCNCWIDQKCSKLSDEEIQELSNEENDWMCYPCKKNIFPCISDDNKVKESTFKPPIWFTNKKCYNCRSKTMKRDCISVYLNNKITYFCSINCTTQYDIEYLDCSICKKYVKNKQN